MIVVSSREPFLAACRELVRRGYDPTTRAVMQHASSANDSLHARIGNGQIRRQNALKNGGPSGCSANFFAPKRAPQGFGHLLKISDPPAEAYMLDIVVCEIAGLQRHGNPVHGRALFCAKSSWCRDASSSRRHEGTTVKRCHFNLPDFLKLGSDRAKCKARRAGTGNATTLAESRKAPCNSLDDKEAGQGPRFASRRRSLGSQSLHFSKPASMSEGLSRERSPATCR